MMQLEGTHLMIEEACTVAQVSRAGYYWYFDEHAPRQAETELRDRIKQVALEHRCYVYRRVTAELRLQGVVVNHKRVLRVMRETTAKSAEAEIYSDYGFQPRSTGIPEPDC